MADASVTLPQISVSTGNSGGSSSPNISRSDNSPTAVMTTPAIGGASTMSFPNDISTMPYYTSMSFVKYSRPFAGSSATEQPTGTIILPIPESLADEQNLRYNGENFGNIGAAAISGVGTALDMGVSSWSEIQKVGGTAYDTFKHSADSGFASLAAKIALASAPASMRDSVVGKGLSAITGIVSNPHLALLFDGVSLRNHSLSWKMSPKTEQEAKDLGKLVYFIKKKSLPSYNATVAKFALDYPDQVKVTFLGVNNQFKDSINKSFITDVSVHSSPEGPSFFKGGNPVVIELRLNLTEVEIRTQDDYPA